MANVSGKKVSSPSSSLSSSSSADSYIGSIISLTSKYEIRYEGVLYYLNPQDSTLGLKNVRSYGTEGRKKDGPQIPPSDKVYEFILFRGSDIKDLQVKSSPPAQMEEAIHNDPAIIQSQFAAGPSSSLNSVSVGGGSLTESSSYQEPTALTTRSYPGILPLHQSGGSWGPFQSSQNAYVSSFSVPMYWQGYNRMPSGFPCAPQHPTPSATTSPSLTVQNLLHAPTTQASTTLGVTKSSNGVPFVPSLTTSNSVHLNIAPAFTQQYATFPTDMTSSLSIESSLPSYPTILTANRLTVSSFPSSCQDVNSIEAPNVGKVGSEPLSVLPIRSFPYSASSVVDSTSGPLLTQPPTLLTPDQLSMPGPSALFPTQKTYPDQKDLGVLSLGSSNSSSSITTPAVQVPLLPLPPSAQQSRHSSHFTEEFDFIAMNEKFKKDEVWGYLGKAKQKEGMEDVAVGQNLGDDEGTSLAPKLDCKPAYSKDEFFDTISCNSHAHGARNGHNRFSERMKQDSETFGNVQQRTHLGYAGYGAGRGVNRGPYNWGRGYSYGFRGHGGYMRM